MKLATLASIALVPIFAVGQAIAAGPAYRVYAAVNCEKGAYKSSEVWSWSAANSASYPWNPDTKSKVASYATVTWEGREVSFPAHSDYGGQEHVTIEKEAFSRPYNTRVGYVFYAIKAPDSPSATRDPSREPPIIRSDSLFMKKQRLDWDGWTCWVIYSTKI
ncbi:hypothetical protein HDU86_001241 [Geranomyces michiganensis]|nr:hypothetical protein HDU86_001241 [Geranomyces michiganensis]